MHVFIPGGAGQVGSILVPALLKSGYTVTVYDQLPQDAFHQIKNHSHLKLVTGSFKDLPCMEAALNGCVEQHDGHDARLYCSGGLLWTMPGAST